jgi:hypothetical protein
MHQLHELLRQVPEDQRSELLAEWVQTLHEALGFVPTKNIVEPVV